MRYAGRKIVDAFDLILTKGIEQENGTIHAYIADATEDCVKAKHDAIDAMIDFITTWFDTMEKSLGLKSLQEYFPKYTEITARISGIQDKIAESRKNRNHSRDGIYDEIERNDYNDILDLYNTMRLSKERVSASIKKQKRKDRVLWVITILSFFFGVWGFLK